MEDYVHWQEHSRLPEKLPIPLTLMTCSVKATESFGTALAQHLCPGDVIACVGGMGMGKTAFARGLARGLGLGEVVSSPTYSIVNVYDGTPLSLYHFDFYRLSSLEDLEQTAYFDILSQKTILLIEWSERIPEAVPPEAYCLAFDNPQQNDRRFLRLSRWPQSMDALEQHKNESKNPTIPHGFPL